jgi:short-subunit dehydrogenase
VLVNNAGIFTQGSLLTDPDDHLENMMDINLFSAYHLTRALLPRMIPQGKGHIFNLCSIASQQAYPDSSSYTITKFAMLGFSKALRRELQDKGIKVTSVIPGATLTASWEGIETPPNRLMDASEVAKAVWSAWDMGPSAVVEEIVMRPQLGDL